MKKQQSEGQQEGKRKHFVPTDVEVIRNQLISIPPWTHVIEQIGTAGLGAGVITSSRRACHKHQSGSKDRACISSWLNSCFQGMENLPESGTS